MATAQLMGEKKKKSVVKRQTREAVEASDKQAIAGARRKKKTKIQPASARRYSRSTLTIARP
jgi:hypothetical protein